MNLVGTNYDGFIFYVLLSFFIKLIKKITIIIRVANRYVDILLKCVLNKVSYTIKITNFQQ